MNVSSFASIGRIIQGYDLLHAQNFKQVQEKMAVERLQASTIPAPLNITWGVKNALDILLQCWIYGESKGFDLICGFDYQRKRKANGQEWEMLAKKKKKKKIGD